MKEPAWVGYGSNHKWQAKLRAKCFDRMNACRRSISQPFRDNICTRCQRIDFEYLFFGNPETGFRDEDESRTLVGWLPDILKTSCDLCEQFAKSAKRLVAQAEGFTGMLLRYTEPGEKVDVNNVYVVLEATDDMWAKDPEYRLETEIDLDHSTVAMHLVVRKFNDYGTLLNQYGIGSINLQLENHRLSRWLLLSNTADLAACKKWYHECTEKHKVCIEGQQDSSSLVTPRGLIFRLMDVDKNQIVEFGPIPHIPYATMSYVCGDKKPDWTLKSESEEWTINEENHRVHPLPQDILSGIADTMIAARAIGLRYLWIDVFCILQDDPVDMACQISAMNAIYTASALSIIDACNPDPSSGLPGLTKSRGATEACHVNIKEGLVISWPQRRSLHSVLDTSKWITRAWCYQEVILSTRSLFFTEHEVFFYCAEATYRESCKTPLPRHTTDRQTQGHWSASELSGNTNIMRLSSKNPANVRSRSKIYKQLVQGYCGRILTKQSDALDAFQGLSNFMEGLLGVRMIHGAADHMFVDCLRWEPQEPRTSGVRRSPRKFLAEHGCDDKPRTLFPSWSWLSRKDKIEFRDSEVSYYQPYRPDTVMRILHRAALPAIPATPETEFKFLTACQKDMNGDNVRTIQGVIPVLTKFAELEMWCYDKIDENKGYPVSWTVRRPDFHMDIGHIRGDRLPHRSGRAMGTFLQIWSRDRSDTSSKVEVLLVNKFNFPVIHGLPGEEYMKETFYRKNWKSLAENLTSQKWEGVNEGWMKEASERDFEEELRILPDEIDRRTEIKPLLVTREGIGTIDEGFWLSAKPQYTLAFLG